MFGAKFSKINILFIVSFSKFENSYGLSFNGIYGIKFIGIIFICINCPFGGIGYGNILMFYGGYGIIKFGGRFGFYKKFGFGG